MMESKQNIASFEKKVLAEEEEIEKLEKRIEAQEESILEKEDTLIRTTEKLKVRDSFSKYQVKLLHSKFLNRLNKHKILYSFITLFSVILIWYGIQNLLATIPFIHNPIVAIILGVLIVWFIDRELT